METIACLGLAATLPRLHGMFAFALWDAEQRSLTLARDRLGIKPLYYGVCNNTFLFGSELKALRAHPAFDAAVDRRALGEFLQHSYVPAPRSIYAGIHKLPPAHVLTVSESTLTTAVPARFWDLPFRATTMASVEWQPEFERRLTEAVRGRMLADVPIGAFLSGGIDSSLIVALMQSCSDRPVSTFTIGFHETDWDEAPFARRIAEHLGTDHTELYVTPKQALDVIPRLPLIYDEPFADVSQIPTWLVCQLARRDVTVCLSGDGGDELFAGYDRYHHLQHILSRRNLVPRPLRAPLARLITHPALRRLRGRSPRDPSLWQGVLQARTITDLYQHLHRHWREPELLVCGCPSTDSVFEFRQQPVFADSREGNILSMMAVDMQAYLPDDILVKVDRASMDVSLEARIPLLDHHVVEHAWQLDPVDRAGHRVTKAPLRKMLEGFIPRELFDRPKAGFGVPIDQWLRGPLREWAEELLDQHRLQREGFLQAAPIQQKWQQHLRGDADWQYLLWDVLMFQAWLEVSAP